MKECFLEYKKREHLMYEKSNQIHQIKNYEYHNNVIWHVVTQAGIKQAGHSKMFTVEADSVKGVVVSLQLQD